MTVIQGGQRWKTAITSVAANRIETRGFPQEDLIRGVSFSDTIFLLLKGSLPRPGAESKLFAAILTACVDHGLTPPSTLATRVVASVRADLPSAVAAGVLAITDLHGGAIEDCMRLLWEAVKEFPREEADVVAGAIVGRSRTVRKRLPGFGHRVHTRDPRAPALLNLAEEAGLRSSYLDILVAIPKVAKKRFDLNLPLNIDGAIAGVALALGFPPEVGKGLFTIGRVPGLVAHALEEAREEKAMRHMGPAIEEVEYTGPLRGTVPIIGRSTEAT